MSRPFATSVRIGDAERDAAVSALNSHFADGRLTTLEHDERITVALAARTSGELDKLFADLPPLEAATPRRRRGPAVAAGRLFAGRVVTLPIALIGLAVALFIVVHLLPLLALIAVVMVVRETAMHRHSRRGRRAWLERRRNGYGYGAGRGRGW